MFAEKKPVLQAGKPFALWLYLIMLFLVLFVCEVAPRSLIAKAQTIGSGTISGRITGTNGGPLHNICVLITDADRPARIYGDYCTNGSGLYSSASLPSGNYVVRANTRPLTHESKYYQDASTFETATRVTVTDGSNVTGVDFTLRRYGKITGRVVDRTSGLPLDNVQVVVRTARTGVVASGGRTYSEGIYTVENLADGSYVVYAEANSRGYANQYYSNASSLAAATTVSVALEVDAASIDFALDKLGSISGRITEADRSTPTSTSAAVMIYRADGGYVGSIQANIDGTYRILGLAVGDYRLLATASTYVSQYYKEALTTEAATLIRVSAPIENLNVDFALTPMGSFSGKAVQSDGVTPEPGVCIDVYPDSGSLIYAAACTGSDGTYKIRGLQSGHYRAAAKFGGLQVAPESYYKDAVTLDAASRFDVSTGNNTEGIDFVMPAHRHIAGTVRGGAQNSPLSGVLVMIQSSSFSDRATTGADGTYRFDRLPTGTYTAWIPAFEQHRAQYYNGVMNYWEATPVDLRNGSADNIDFNLIEPGSITGRVTREDGVTPIPNILVEAVGPVTMFAWTGTDGSYKIDRLVTGSYRIGVDWQSGYLVQYYPNTDRWEAAAQVQVGAPYTTPNINFALQEGGRLSGKVTNADGTVPISDVTVEIYSASDSFGRQEAFAQVRTANDGSYSFFGLPSADIRLMVDARHRDYLPQYYRDSLYPEQASSVAVGPGNHVRDVNFALVRPGTVSGRVIESDGGAPVPVACVRVYRYASESYVESASSCSDSDGYYHVGGLPPGVYKVGVSRSGYKQKYHGGADNVDSATDVSVAAGNDTVIDFELVKLGSISGKVTKADGAPFPDIQVRAETFDTNPCCIVVFATTGTDGAYQFKGLVDGDYRVRVEATNLGYFTQWYEGAFLQELASTVEVFGPNDTPSIDFSLLLPGWVSGKITLGDGVTPLENACVSAYDFQSQFHMGFGACTGSDGTYRFLAPATDYKLAVTYLHTVVAFSGGGISLSTAGKVAVTSEKTTNVDFILGFGGISGKITRLDGTTPIAAACVTVLAHPSNTPLLIRCVDQDGSYSFPPLPVGNYRLRAQAPGYLTEYYGEVWKVEEAAIVTVVDSAVTRGIDITLPLPGSISGKVTQADGVTPISNATVDISSPCCFTTTTGTDGTYRFPRLRGGDHVVRARATGYVSEYFDNAQRSALATPVHVTLEQDTSNINFALVTPGAITGKVTRIDGTTPIADARIMAVQRQEGTVFTARTASDGTYSLLGISSGGFDVWVTAPGYLQQYYKGATTTTAAIPVQVTAPETTSGVDFALTAAGSLSGQIAKVDGTAITASSCIFVAPFNMDDQSPIAGTGRCLGTSTTYAIPDLAPGDYLIWITMDGYARKFYQGSATPSGATKVVVTSGNDTPGIDFGLVPGGQITGKAMKADGTPLADEWIRADTFDGTVCCFWAKTGSDGNYSLSSLPVGEYRVFADTTIANRGLVARYFGNTTTRDVATKVTLTTAGASNINITLLPPELSVTKTGAGTGTVTATPPDVQCGAQCAALYTMGAEVTLIAMPDSGSYFAGWGGACTGKGSCKVTMNQDKSVTAVFKPDPVMLTVIMIGTGAGIVTTNPGGLLCDPSCDRSFEYGSEVVVQALPATTSKVAGLSGACAGTGPCVLAMNGPKTVTVSFASAPAPAPVPGLPWPWMVVGSGILTGGLWWVHRRDLKSQGS